jgi:hypothetical protein
MVWDHEVPGSSPGTPTYADCNPSSANASTQIARGESYVADPPESDLDVACLDALSLPSMSRQVLACNTSPRVVFCRPAHVPHSGDPFRAAARDRAALFSSTAVR